MNSRCFILPLNSDTPFVSNRWLKVKLNVLELKSKGCSALMFSNSFSPIFHLSWPSFIFASVISLLFFLVRIEFEFSIEKIDDFFVNVKTSLFTCDVTRRGWYAFLLRHKYLQNVAKFAFEFVFPSLCSYFLFLTIHKIWQKLSYLS